MMFIILLHYKMSGLHMVIIRVIKYIHSKMIENHEMVIKLNLPMFPVLVRQHEK